MTLTKENKMARLVKKILKDKKMKTIYLSGKYNEKTKRYELVFDSNRGVIVDDNYVVSIDLNKNVDKTFTHKEIDNILKNSKNEDLYETLFLS